MPRFGWVPYSQNNVPENAARMKTRSWCRRTHDAWWWGMGIILMFTLWGSWMQDAYALPAFARKYQVNCNVCHTRQPRLNSFGEQFLENGYQMPGTEDGGIVEKLKYGDVTLDQVSNYLGILFGLNALENTQLRRDVPGSGDQTDIASPRFFECLRSGPSRKCGISC